MAFKMRGFSAFTKTIAKEKQFTETQDEPKKPDPKIPIKGVSADRWNEASEEILIIPPLLFSTISFKK